VCVGKLSVHNDGRLLTAFTSCSYRSASIRTFVVLGVVVKWRKRAMAERTTSKAKRPEPPVNAPKGAAKKARMVKDAGKDSAATSGATLSALAEENARLKAELAEASERIADLELRQTEITNRIAWVIDSLHNLAD